MEGKATVNTKASVECLEISIPAAQLLADNNLGWTLSVYSLQNRPLPTDPAGKVHYHFMVYDWRKTIQQLLHQHNIAFSITDSFFLNTVAPPGKHKKVRLAEADALLLFGPGNQLASHDELTSVA
jgi:hypothetical protein